MRKIDKSDTENIEFENLRKRIKGFASQAKRGMCSSRFDSSDITQLACIQVWQAWQGVEDAGIEHLITNSPFLKKVCFGQTANLVRFHHAHRRTQNREDHGRFEEIPIHRTPLENAEIKEDLELLNAAIASLGNESRELIAMRFEQAMTFEEIAIALNRSTNWVYRNLKKSLSEITKYMLN